jgi:hypothetical protein
MNAMHEDAVVQELLDLVFQVSVVEHCGGPAEVACKKALLTLNH